MRTPVPHRSPPRKDFCRAKMPCGGQVFQICCSAVKSSDFLHASRYLHARKRVLPKYVEDARLGGHCKSGTPGISKGPQPFYFRRSPEETLSRVSFGQLLPGGSTRRFFAQLRSVGSKKNQLAGFCQFKLALAATAGSNDYSSSCSGSTLSIEITRLPSSTRIKITPCVSRL